MWAISIDPDLHKKTAHVEISECVKRAQLGSEGLNWAVVLQEKKQNWRCTCNVKWRRVRETIIAVEKQ